MQVEKKLDKDFRVWAKNNKIRVNQNSSIEADMELREDSLYNSLFDRDQNPVEGFTAIPGSWPMESSAPHESFLSDVISSAIEILPDCKWGLESIVSSDDWVSADVELKHRTKGTYSFRLDDVNQSEWLPNSLFEKLEEFSVEHSKYKLLLFTIDTFFTFGVLRHKAADELHGLLYPSSPDVASDITREEELESLIFPYEIHKVHHTEVLAKFKELKGENRGVPIILGPELEFHKMQVNLSEWDTKKLVRLFDEANKEKDGADEELTDAVNELFDTPTNFGVRDSDFFTNSKMRKYDGESADELIAKSESINIQDWFEQRKTSLPEAKIDLPAEQSTETEKTDYDDLLDVDGLPKLETDMIFRSCFDEPRDEPHEEIYITVLPTKHAWQAPCFLNTRGYDPHADNPWQYEAGTCPDLLRHAAIFRYWQEKHGAEIVVVTSKVIEAVIKAPPETETDATQLAYEQYYYNPDLVRYNVGAIKQLSNILKVERFWYFEWDWLLGKRAFDCGEYFFFYKHPILLE